MASYRWTGASSSVWKLAGNWVDALTGAVVAGYPGDTALQYDKVYFDTAKNSGNDCAGVTALTETLSSIFIGAGWDGIIGSGATPVEVGCSNVMIESTSSGAIYLKGIVGSSLTTVVVRSGAAVYLDGLISTAYLLKATNVTLQPTINMSTGGGSLWISKVTSETDVTVTVEDGATLIERIYQNGGTITFRNNISNLQISGGIAKVYGSISGELNVHGGQVDWYSGTIAQANLFGGKLDGTKSSTARTLTGAVLGPGGILDLSAISRNITLSFPIVHLGGTLVPPPGSSIDIT